MTDSSDKPIPDFARMRVDYMQRSLSETDVDANPIRQFLRWFDESLSAGAHEPNAMTLATATPDGIPSARIVLLKGVDERGFSFYTNYLSHKGRELEANPWAAVVFYWPELERQVRVEGSVAKTSRQESEEYFAGRPVNSQIGSAASPQSQPIESREVLVTMQADLRNQHPDGKIPCPPHWGGYRLAPRRVEFWQGRESRVHDRIEYIHDAGSGWNRRRLAP